MLVFVLGLLLVLLNNFKPSEEEEREFLVLIPFIYRYHGKAVLVFVLGLLLVLPNNFKPSEEEEREFLVLIPFIYRYHGKAVLIFCRTWQPRFKLTLFSVIKPSLGGRKLLVSIYYYHGKARP